MPTFLLVLIIFLLPWYYYVQIFARLAPQPTQVGVFRGDPPGEDLTTTLKELERLRRSRPTVAEPTYFCSNSIVLKRHVSSRWQHPDQTDKRSLFLKFDYFSSDFVWF